MDEKKPDTSLVVLPPLEMIPLPSLSTHHRSKLSLQKTERKKTRGHLVAVTVGATLTASLPAAAGWIFFLMLLAPGVPFIAILFMMLVFGACSWWWTSFMLKELIMDARKFRQLPSITPQLEAGAKTEEALVEAAKNLNWHIADWNLDATEAAQNGAEPEVIAELRTHRKSLQEHRDYLKTVSDHLSQDRKEE